MHQILVGRASEGAFTRSEMEQVFRFRHRIFKERLGWDVRGERGMERDEFDDLDPVHIAVRRSGDIIAYWRLLPSTGPYMLRDTFSALLRNEAAPCDSGIWELSRFAVDGGGLRGQATFSRVTLDLMRACYRYAESAGIHEFVTVTSVSLERMMRAVGVPLERFGDGRTERVGGLLCVACRVPVGERLRAALWKPTQSGFGGRSVA
ncbi:MAG: acyl-homoserine-lactone synthase [Ectothiorhodospiraceae bacterium]|jgi:acyl homoserine lactone synthase